MKKPILVILLFALASLITACSGDSPQAVPPTIIPVKGDPMTFLRNTQGDTEVGIPASLFAEDQSTWMLIKNGFVEVQQEQIDSLEQAAEDQAPTTTEEIEQAEAQAELFVMPQISEDTDLTTIDFESNQGLTLRFNVSDGKLLLDQIFTTSDPSDQVAPLKIHHYSASIEKDAFSILISFDFLPGRKALQAFYFTRFQDVSVMEQTLNTAYNFLFGPGVGIGWDQSKPVTPTLCHQSAHMYAYSDWAREAVKAWNPALEGRLVVATQDRFDSCPPFSDLNTQTISHIDNWIEIQSTEVSTSAFVLPIPNIFTSKMVDADMFVIEKEWTKGIGEEQVDFDDPRILANPVVSDLYRFTITHEMGHILGLHHEFDEYSVMGYGSAETITLFDESWIQELYPKVDDDTKEAWWKSLF